jgi:hypothetical protein
VEFYGGLEYVNHSCSPNTRIVLSESTTEVAFIALKSIRANEYLTFDYTSSEWDMDEKFECNCGSPNCRGFIGGAKYLSDKEIKTNCIYLHHKCYDFYWSNVFIKFVIFS